MPHVLHIIESLEFGGAEKVVLHLANGMCNSFKVSICLTKRKGELLAQVSDNIQVHFLDGGEGNSLSLPKKLKQIIIDNKVDIVHSHDWGVYLESALATHQSGRAELIHTVHGQYTHYADNWKSSIKIAIRHQLERIASRKTFKIVPVSNSIKQYISDDIKISKKVLQTIHNGIKDVENLEAIEALQKTDNRYIELISVGRLAEVKNLPLLIQALNIAVKTNNQIRLTIAGDGPQMQPLKTLVNQLELTEHVIFKGFISDITPLLATKDVFVISSFYEGISIAILEAMRIAMPVIATDVGGISETVCHEKTGLVVKSDDVEAYARAIIKMASSHEYRCKLGQAGKKHFKQNFHEEVVLNQYHSLYEKAVLSNQ